MGSVVTSQEVGEPVEREGFDGFCLEREIKVSEG